MLTSQRTVISSSIVGGRGCGCARCVLRRLASTVKQRTMSRRTGSNQSPSASRRRPETLPEEPEEGELSDEPGPSTASQARDRAASDASDSPKGFAKIPLPFKPRNKTDARPAKEVRSKGPRSYDRPSEPAIHPMSNAYDRWPPNERDRSYPDYRGVYPGHGELDYRDARYDPSARYAGPDTYVPSYNSDVYDHRRSRPSELYPTEESDYDHSRRRDDERESYAPRSPTLPGPHRLPKRPSLSPGRRRRDDDVYRPRSPDVSLSSRIDPPYDEYHRPIRNFELPPRPPSPSDLSNDPRNALPPNPSMPNTYLPQTEGKFRINVKLRSQSSIPERATVNHLDPDMEPPNPPVPSKHPPVPLPQNGVDDFLNGAPPPPTDEPPPIPPPFVPKYPVPPPPGINGLTKPADSTAEYPTKVESSSKGVPLIKATGTKNMRSPEAEMEAYNRTFLGVDKLADYELMNKLGEGTFG